MGSGEAVADAVLSTDLVEQHLGGLDPEAVGEDLAVVGEDLLWHPVALEGLGEEAAHSSGAVGAARAPGPRWARPSAAGTTAVGETGRPERGGLPVHNGPARRARSGGRPRRPRRPR